MEFKFNKVPSAWLPIIMSIIAVFLLLLQLATNGFRPEIDEGAIAHVWQLLVVTQIPVIVFFAFRWVRRAPREALTIMVMQGLALASAAVPVFLLKW